MTSNIKIKKNNNEVSSIIIDEPKTYNSLSFKNLSDLLKALKKLDADKKVKVIILEGAGKGFSAGHNLKEVRGLKKRDKYLKLFNELLLGLKLLHFQLKTFFTGRMT